MTHKHPSPEETLSEIRHLMERSSRFISLSGFSGIFAGIYALAGAFAAYFYLNPSEFGARYDRFSVSGPQTTVLFLLGDAAIVLVLAVGTGILLTTRKARKDGNSLL